MAPFAPTLQRRKVGKEVGICQGQPLREQDCPVRHSKYSTEWWRVNSAEALAVRNGLPQARDRRQQ